MQRIEILNKIRDLQTKKDNQFYNKGIFPSYRSNKILRLTRPDDNIFCSAAILYIIKSLTDKLTPAELFIVNDIERNLQPNFHLHMNKHSRNSYNFWQKKDKKQFPNGLLLHKFNKFRLPDDMDTTSMIQMLNNMSQKEALKTKLALPNHANNSKNSIKNGHAKFRKLDAYSTWFGENMPIEFDVCVLCNTLLWINHYNFTLKKCDIATIKLIKETIIQSLYFKSPFKCAPEYPKTEIILYHISRVMSETPYLKSLQNKLINDLHLSYQKCTNLMDKTIIETSLLRLGEKINITKPKELTIETRKYWWFTAGLLSVYSNPVIQTIAPFSLFHFRFLCPSLNLALIFENHVLSD